MVVVLILFVVVVPINSMCYMGMCDGRIHTQEHEHMKYMIICVHMRDTSTILRYSLLLLLPFVR